MAPSAPEPSPQHVASRPVAVVDIDGVVADVRHRLHHVERRPKNWTAFFAAAAHDGPHPEGLAVVVRLAADHDIVYLTGRPERLRQVTERWLKGHGIGGYPVLMRPNRDHRPAARWKVEMLVSLSAERDVAVVVDDDVEVLAAIAGAGFATLRADWERRDPDEAAALLEAQEREGRT